MRELIVTQRGEAYAWYFGERPPARTAVAVAGLPRDSLVEIEATALE